MEWQVHGTKIAINIVYLEYNRLACYFCATWRSIVYTCFGTLYMYMYMYVDISCTVYVDLYNNYYVVNCKFVSVCVLTVAGFVDWV